MEREEMMQQLMEILEELRPDVNFNEEKSLIDEGVFDSFDIVSLVGELNDNFEIEINVNDLLPENFNSAENMLELVEKLQQD